MCVSTATSGPVKITLTTRIKAYYLQRLIYSYVQCLQKRSFTLGSNTATKRFPLSFWPHLFRGAGHGNTRREQLKWSVAFSLYIGSFPCATATRASSYSPVGPSVFFVYLVFVFCIFICVSSICLCVPILLCFPGQLSHLPYSFWS